MVFYGSSTEEGGGWRLTSAALTKFKGKILWKNHTKIWGPLAGNLGKQLESEVETWTEEFYIKKFERQN